MREHITGSLTSGNRDVYEFSVKKLFERTKGPAPATRQEVRKLMKAQPYHQYWSALMRTTQEVMWESVGSSVEREFGRLAARAKKQDSRKGSLKLDAALAMPRYVTAVDIHCMPDEQVGGAVDVKVGGHSAIVRCAVQLCLQGHTPQEFGEPSARRPASAAWS